MKNLLAVIGDGNAGPVLEAALMAARRFNSHIVGLHSLTTEYAVVFGGEMGFSISSEVDRTLEREGHERRDQARRLFRDFMERNGVSVGPPAPGEKRGAPLGPTGLIVTLRTAFGRKKPKGESFLKEARAAGADLLVKGAYTQSRIRQMIFGGATRHIIMEARIPVIMAR